MTPCGLRFRPSVAELLSVQAYTADGLLGLLHRGLADRHRGLPPGDHGGRAWPGWSAADPTRMTNGVFVTGFLIVAITVVGTMAVSCSGGADGRAASQRPSR